MHEEKKRTVYMKGRRENEKGILWIKNGWLVKEKETKEV